MLRLHEYSPVFDADGSRHTRSSSSRTSADGCGRVSESRCPPTHRGVRCLCEWRARARHRASASRYLRCGLLRLAGRRLPTACRDAEFASAHVPRRRHAGAVLPRERDPVGGRAARCRCGRRHDRAGRVARRRVLERRVSADGGVGVWTMSTANSCCRFEVNQRAGLTDTASNSELISFSFRLTLKKVVKLL